MHILLLVILFLISKLNILNAKTHSIAHLHLMQGFALKEIVNLSPFIFQSVLIFIKAKPTDDTKKSNLIACIILVTL